MPGKVCQTFFGNYTSTTTVWKKNIELAKYIGKIVNLYISAVLVLDSRRLCGALVFIQKRQRAHCGKKIYIFLNVRRI